MIHHVSTLFCMLLAHNDIKFKEQIYVWDDFLSIPLYLLLLHDPSFYPHPQYIRAARQRAYNSRGKYTKAKLRGQRDKDIHGLWVSK